MEDLGEIVNIAMVMEKPLLLMGEAGTGKTQLAFEVARSLKMDIKILFQTIPAVLRQRGAV